MLIEKIVSDFSARDRADFVATAVYIFLINDGLNRYLQELTRRVREDLAEGEALFNEARVPFKSVRRLVEKPVYRRDIGKPGPTDDSVVRILRATDLLCRAVEMKAGAAARVGFAAMLLKKLKAHYDSGVAEGVSELRAGYVPHSRKALETWKDVDCVHQYIVSAGLPYDPVSLFAEEKSDRQYAAFDSNDEPQAIADKLALEIEAEVAQARIEEARSAALQTAQKAAEHRQQEEESAEKPKPKENAKAETEAESRPDIRDFRPRAANPFGLLATPVYEKHFGGRHADDQLLCAGTLCRSFMHFVMDFLVTKVGKDEALVRTALDAFLARECTFFSTRELRLHADWRALFERFATPIEAAALDSETAAELSSLFHLFLISATPADRLFTDDATTQYLALSVLKAAGKLCNDDARLKESVAKATAVVKQTPYPSLGLTLGPHQSVIYNSSEVGDFNEALNFFPLSVSIETTADLVLSRLNINCPRAQLEQFLAEQRETLRYVEELKPLSTYRRAAALFDELKIEKPKPRAEIPYFDDGPTSPEQIFGFVGMSFAKLSPAFAAHFSLSVLIVIMEKALQLKASGDDGKAWGSVLDADFNRRARLFAMASDAFKASYTGNRYRDTFEYGANQLSIQSLREKEESLNAKIVKLKTQSQALQEKFRASLDDLSALKAELGVANDETQQESQADNTLPAEKTPSKKLDEVTDLLNYALEENQLASFTIEELQNFNQKLKDEKIRLEGKLAALAFEKKKVGKKESDFFSEAVYSLLADDWVPTPEHALKLLATLAPDRLVIHEKTWESVKKVNSGFKNGRRLFEALRTLAFDYLDRYLAGGDQLARGVFPPNTFSANESEGTANSRDPKIRNCRRIVYRGKTLDLEAHLKLGVTPQDSIRIYFTVDRELKKIVIGYCGPHPKNLSTN